MMARALFASLLIPVTPYIRGNGKSRGTRD